MNKTVDELVAERGGIYGHPYDNFNNIATLWTDYIVMSHGSEIRLTREDVAKMMILLKIARSVNQTQDADTIDDIGGYAKCIHMIREMQNRETNII